MYSRKQRGKTQNLYLIEILNKNIDNQRDFHVMGTTGNIYKVSISEKPSCNCPDYKLRFNRCKHIYFILVRVMKVNEIEEDKNKYNKTDLIRMFANMKTVTDLIVSDSIKNKYEKIKNKGKLDDKNDSVVDKKSLEDICPICLDDLNNEEELDYCKYSCGKSIHKKCFEMWSKHHKALCVFCRHEWNGKTDEYVNLLN
ncbi:RING finger protein [uncultured virus]|nr:RING finger protein [uncultured virus]